MKTYIARHLTEEQREEACAWLEAHDMNPREVSRLVIHDDGTYEVEVFLKDPEGKKYLKPGTQDLARGIIRGHD